MNIYNTKNGQEVTVNLFPIKEDIVKSRLFDSFVAQAIINNEVVGYAKFVFIGKDKANQLIEPFDFFIYKVYASNNDIIKAYEKHDFKFLIENIALKYLQISKDQVNRFSKSEIIENFQKFKDQINQTYQQQFSFFTNYWINKPNIELIRVLSADDNTFTDFNKKHHPLTPRNPTNWQGQGIGLILYEHIAQWCKNNNLELWSSTNQTEDGKKMWKIMETHPKFTVMMTELNKYTTAGKIISTVNRPKLILA